MITEYHFPTPIYIKEIPNAGELNHHLEKISYNGKKTILKVLVKQMLMDGTVQQI